MEPDSIANRAKKLVASLAVILIIFAAMPASAWAAKAGDTYKVNVSSVKLRAKASSKGKAVKTLKKGNQVEILADKGAWVKVKIGGKTGYVQEKKLKKVSKAKESTSSKKIEVAHANGNVKSTKSCTIYKENSTKSKKVIKIKKGVKLTLTGSVGSWYKVKTASGKVGFVKQSCVKKVTESTETKYTTLKKGSKGSKVKKLQQRLNELGYLNKNKINSKYDSSTVNAVKAFQKAAKLSTKNGTANAVTQKVLYASDAPKKSGSSKNDTNSSGVMKMDWFKNNMNSIFPRRSYAYIEDVKTGTRIKIRRVGGSKHADIEPATASDTAKLKKLYGGSWSWNSRSVILEVDGKRIAGAINGMPHGDGISTTNNFDGHFCLHLTNSRCHGSDKINQAHQKAIEYAFKNAK